MKFAIKLIGFYIIALIIAFAVCGLVNAGLFLWMNYIGLSEFGDLWLFRIGLALVEAGCCTYAVSSISEDVLFKVNERTTEPPETGNKEAT